MSKAKDNYYELKGYLDRYMGGPVNDVSNYVTELEKKAEMFDDLAAALHHVYMHESGNYACEDIENILERAKKIQGD
jgi:hypothetical protein